MQNLDKTIDRLRSIHHFSEEVLGHFKKTKNENKLSLNPSAISYITRYLNEIEQTINNIREIIK